MGSFFTFEAKAFKVDIGIIIEGTIFTSVKS